MVTVLKTKFGNASINDGYYTISSKKEGNNGKRLHRLIWEDFYGRSIPEGYVIHHMNGNKLDCRIQNLQCCKLEHHSRFHTSGKNSSFYGVPLSEEHKQKISDSISGENHHMWGKNHSNDTKLKIGESLKGKSHSLQSKKNMSNSHNTSGYFRVSKHHRKGSKQGFAWRYRYYENGKQKAISSISLEKLEEKVRDKGLEWFKISSGEGEV